MKPWGNPCGLRDAIIPVILGRLTLWVAFTLTGIDPSIASYDMGHRVKQPGAKQEEIIDKFGEAPKCYVLGMATINLY